ncbi:type I-E CRISPR-associated protein Cas7/Cse4/CasC [Streptomyces sp. NPDC056503]|uniref:type I-E CRISPR-associated protein Cas7/Cse4/CasC n=1 Tax=Streptomyces sp. NPDC056503 TaxID=3345842 RepID=UPI00367D4257
MTIPPLYVDVHVLQSVPPSNLNRDDSGTPKQATFGGAKRARVSSQAWKRATRTHYASGVAESDRATRTKKIRELLAGRLAQAEGLDAEKAGRLAAALVKPLGIKASQKKGEESAYLLFFGKTQLDGIIALLGDRAVELAGLPDDDLDAEIKQLPVQEELTKGHPAEVALFGRMVADLAALNVDASVQVAHALSTHKVQTEFDYYTAVDDENTSDSGAGMIGTVEFNSATLYRYATLGIHQLHENLGDDTESTAETAGKFVDSFVRSMPTGHQNTFAHRTLPHLVLVTVRTDQPVNLVSAYEKPVASTHGIAEESAQRLAEELQSVTSTWGSVPALTLATYVQATDKLNDAFGASLPFPQLLEKIHAAVAGWLEHGEIR